MSARAGGTGSILLLAKTHEGVEEGRKGGGLGVTRRKYSLSLQTRPFPVPVQSFPTEGGSRVRGLVETTSPP